MFRAGPYGLPCYPQATALRYTLPARSARSVRRLWVISPLVRVGQLAQYRLMQVSRVDHDIRKFVRSRATRAFLTAEGDWTADASTATVFPSTEAAREIVLKHRITDAELYYQFGEKPSQYDFTLSL